MVSIPIRNASGATDKIAAPHVLVAYMRTADLAVFCVMRPFGMNNFNRINALLTFDPVHRQQSNQQFLGSGLVAEAGCGKDAEGKP